MDRLPAVAVPAIVPALVAPVPADFIPVDTASNAAAPPAPNASTATAYFVPVDPAPNAAATLVVDCYSKHLLLILHLLKFNHILQILSLQTAFFYALYDVPTLHSAAPLRPADFAHRLLLLMLLIMMRMPLSLVMLLFYMNLLLLFLQL